MDRKTAVASAVLLGATTAAWAADTRFGLEADLARDSNVNRAASDKRADTYLTAEGYAARSVITGTRSGLVLRGAIRGREYFDYSDLSNLAATGRLAWRYQPNPGYTGAFFELALSGEAFQFRDSDIRNGQLLGVSASAGKYVTDRVRLGAGVGYDRRWARKGDVYDLKNPKAWLSIDYKIAERITLYGSGTWIGGDQVFTARTAGPGWNGTWASQGYNNLSYKASAADPVFDANGDQFTAYRNDAKTTVAELGLNWGITGTQAIDIGATWYSSRPDSGPKYDGWIARIGWLMRFR
ncbi:MAG: hypothetical protein KIT73_07855 [Burkholderiales bacterium]|nr:hypothetical protein [Burkholderiales bacterium]